MMKVRITSEFQITAVETVLSLDTKISDVIQMHDSPDAFVVEIIRVHPE